MIAKLWAALPSAYDVAVVFFAVLLVLNLAASFFGNRSWDDTLKALVCIIMSALTLRILTL